MGGLTIGILNYDSETFGSHRKRHQCQHLFSQRHELARLASFPEKIPSDDLIRAFTLTGADRDLVVIRRGAANRLGLALQLCALRYFGFVPRNLSAAPRSAACFVADQLEVSPDEIQSYARREQTRRQHFSEVREHLGFSMLRLEPPL